VPSECCSDVCENGVCGGGVDCPLTGDPCGDCVAQSCCAQANQCFADPDCQGDIACFFSCIQGGGGPAICGFQCINSPAAFQLLICVGQSCGAGTCF
jgi:hypothetical protein